MCRSIKVLNTPDQPVTQDELNNAALQYVRKISGYNKPSRVNQEAFQRAVAEIAQSSQRLLSGLVRSPKLKSFSIPPFPGGSDCAIPPAAENPKSDGQ